MGQASVELSTLGGLLRFAASLEREAESCYQGWSAEANADRRALLSALAASHRKRATQLERILREHLNEMTLEPISGLHAQDYLSPVPADSDRERPQRAVELEEGLARLYHDMLAQAKRILGGAVRSIERFAEEARLSLQELQGARRGEQI